MMLSPSLQNTFRSQSVTLALLLSLGASALLLVTNNPLAPLVVAGGLCAMAVAYVLIQKPLFALYLALFLHLAPKSIRIDGIYDLIVHSTTALALLGWLLQTVSHQRRILWNMVCLLTIVYIAWAFASLLWASDVVEGRKKLINYIIGFILVFMISNHVRSIVAVDGLMRVLRYCGWIMVLGGAYAFLTDYQSGERLTAWGENQNGLGLILIIMLPGVIWPVFRSAGLKRQINMTLSIIYILWTLVLIALSGSRGSSISIALVLLIYWFFKPTRPWGMVGVLLVIGAVAGAPFLLDGLSKRFEEGEGGSLGGREELWRASVLLIQDHPLTGAGIGNGPSELPLYLPEVSNDPYKLRKIRYPSHNPVLEATTDTGIPGMIIYISLCASALIQFFRSRNYPSMRDGPLAAYFPLILGVTIGFMASWIKAGGLEANPIFFVLLALLILPSQISQRLV